MSKILGISCFYHDSAATLLVDGKVVAAAQEERFTRRKHDPEFPTEAIKFCLQQGQINLAQLDRIVFYDKPLLKFERLLETYLAHAPRGFTSFLNAIPIWAKQKLFLKQTLRKALQPLLDTTQVETSTATLPALEFTQHHQSHAGSAYYPSPFNEAAVVCLDGVGEWATTSIWHGQGSQLTALREIHFPHSLGLLYSAFTYYCGFKVNSGEYKLMGLAPYGQPRYVDTILQHLITLHDDGSFALNMDYFAYPIGDVMTSAKFHQLFQAPPYIYDSPPDQRCMDLARSIQVVIEMAVINIAKAAQKSTGSQNLCLAGGVALNCVANGKLREAGIFQQIWVQPAAGDAGGSLGAAYCSYYLHHSDAQKPTSDQMQSTYLGPSFTDEQILKALKDWQLPYRKVEQTPSLLTEAAKLLAADKVVGWFQGAMEFGPRALGNRSILGNPASSEMQSVMNLKIKQRESFRPFAPAILQERLTEYFDTEQPSPYMLDVANIKQEHRLTTNTDSPNPSSQSNEKPLQGMDLLAVERSILPAITHVDFSARVQTVNAQSNPLFHQLISEFDQLTGLPVIINTSFNVRGEPPVCTPNDAVRCFLATDMDYLCVGSFVLNKQNMPVAAIEKAKSVTFTKD